MNAMTSALANAGIPLPSQMERIWRFYKDYPNSNINACASRLSLARGNVSSLAAQLEKRGMVTRRLVPMKCRVGKSFGERNIAFFTAVGDKYELQPAPTRTKKTKATPPPPAPAKPKPAVVRTTEPQAPKPAADDKFDLDSLTVGEARELYARLKRMFG